MPTGAKGYRVEIFKPKIEILLSDFGLWHYPLSGWGYIGSSEADAKQFQQIYGDYSDINAYPPKIQEEIKSSWERIFDMTFDCDYHTHPFGQKAIQATFWELRIAEVGEVDAFIAR